ncbi:MAG: sodium:solute symporter [Flavobacteriales bacterium]
MSNIDWLVLGLTLGFIIVYGVWKSRGTNTMQGYLLADQKLPWYHVGLSVMATQASAITFLSAPGQAYTDGMRFVQFYFGLPFAMIVLCITFIPAFKKLNVYTAYEYLENRFDIKTRSLTAVLFLIQRGISTGITIYAPAIILSTILQVQLNYTIVIMGLLVIGYTVYGGTKAVSYTQLAQMVIIFSGLFLAGYMVIHLLPENVGWSEALHISGKLDRTQVLDTEWNPDEKYNLWSGLIGGFFLQLSYFGTDQSQVGRYLTGSSIRQSRLGLLMNGIVKIPMQFMILMLGALVLAFYQYYTPPIFFNQTAIEQIENTEYADAFHYKENEFNAIQEEKQRVVASYVEALHNNDEVKQESLGNQLKELDNSSKKIRNAAVALLKEHNDDVETNDSNYIFLNFVTHHLPKGIIGLVIAIIFLASMGSSASGLNSLASTSAVDFYKRFIKKEEDKADVAVTRWLTIGWGVFCILVALFASQLGNLIEAVNILGSLFYGTILGIFVVAFYLKKVSGNEVFIAAIITEIVVYLLWYYDAVAYLWLNVIGCLLLVAIALILQQLREQKLLDFGK